MMQNPMQRCSTAASDVVDDGAVKGTRGRGAGRTSVVPLAEVAACYSYASAQDMAFSISCGFWRSTSILRGSSRPLV